MRVESSINVAKSISANRLIRHKPWFEKFFGNLVEFLSPAAILAISGALLHRAWQNHRLITWELVVFGLVLSICLLVGYSIINNSKFKVIQASTKQENKALAIKISKSLGWKTIETSKSHLVFALPRDWLSFDWGKRVVVIFDGQRVLINCTCYAAFDLESAYHWYVNRKIENEFARVITQTQQR